MTQDRTATIERLIPQPPEKIWRALTQPHLVSEWLMKGDIQPVPGHRFQLTGEWGGVLECEMLTVEPPNSLSYRWDFPHDDPAYALRSIVTFTLTPTEAGTLLRVEQTGFRPEQKQAYGGAHAGWKGFLEKLETLLGDLG